jgi:putrescine---pyruvate transaminase
MQNRQFSSAELKALDVKHHLPAQTDYQLQERLGGSRIIVKAKGAIIEDADGHQLLDAMAGLWCVNAGYGRDELARVAYEQMRELPYYNTFFKSATAPAILLAAKVAEKLGEPLQHIFFNNSGSEAIDTAFRLARHYWTLKGQPQRKVFISRINAYHGSTVAGTSLGGMKFMHEQGDLPIPGIEHVAQPYSFMEANGRDEATFTRDCVAAIEQRIIEVGPENVAAFIGEPVQGAGGVIIPPPGYWKQVEALCRRYGILLICDEVICGFGRLGHWFGFQHFGVTPDMVTMAKGLSSGYLPISATAVSREIINTLRQEGGEFSHGYTYSGHPASCAVALANIEILEREGLIERTRTDTGPYLQKKLTSLLDHPLVGEVRSLGLIGGVEIVSKPKTNERFTGKEGVAGPLVRDRVIAKGVMVRAIRDTLVFSPPLIISHAQIDQLINTIREALDESTAALRALPVKAD